jgi:hypothetical protein
MATCTWQGCPDPATNPNVAEDGNIWSCLCHRHQAEYKASIKGVNRTEADRQSIARMMHCWIQAQGGPKKAADRMTGGNDGEA